MNYVGEQMTMDFRKIGKLTRENRNAAYESVKGNLNDRRRLVLAVLGDKEMTVSEICEELLQRGEIAYFNRNYVAPRVTELKDLGYLVACGSRPGTRSDRKETIWKRAVI